MLATNKRKIVIMVDWFDPGYKAGGPIQSCKNFVKTFKNSYDLYVITSDRDMGDAVSYPGIQTNRWIKYEKEANIYYASVGNLNANTIRKLIAGIKPDYVYLNSMFSAKFTIIPLLLKLLKLIPGSIILSPRGMLQAGAIRFKTGKKIFFLTVLKFLNAHRQITFHATDEQEKADVLSCFPNAGNVFVAGNMGPVVNLEWVPVAKVSGALKLIFLSRISPKKNLHYILELLTGSEFKGNIILDIAGEVEDKQYWEACQAIIRNLPLHVQVHYIGSIKNEEVYRKYAGYHVFVLPTLGENFGHAIMEALLAGKPVLISDKTPWKNLAQKQIGYDIPLDQPDLFKAAIQKFVEWDQPVYDLWSRSAWLFAKDYASSNDAKAKYMEVFK